MLSHFFFIISLLLPHTPICMNFLAMFFDTPNLSLYLIFKVCNLFRLVIELIFHFLVFFFLFLLFFFKINVVDGLPNFLYSLTII